MTQPGPANEPQPENVTGADAPPTVDPAIAALYRPPFQPGLVHLHVAVHVDPDGLWVEVPELPGLFATGETIPQLGAALGEAVESYLLERTTIVRTGEEPTEGGSET